MKQIHWTKRLFRLWLVNSAVWIIVTVGYSMLRPVVGFWMTVSIALIFPIVILAIGASLCWAFRGFLFERTQGTSGGENSLSRKKSSGPLGEG